MENLRKIQECNKRNMTLRQAFFQLGMTEVDKPLRELNEKEEFSALVNWALNKLPPFQSMDLRKKVNGEIYQTPIHKSGRQLVVGKPVFRASHPGTILYNWPKEMKYELLDVDTIATSVIRADIVNAAKIEGRLLTEQQIAEKENPQMNWDNQIQKESLQIKLVKTERNCWDVVLTEEERNLLGEFLDI